MTDDTFEKHAVESSLARLERTRTHEFMRARRCDSRKPADLPAQGISALTHTRGFLARFRSRMKTADVLVAQRATGVPEQAFQATRFRPLRRTRRIAGLRHGCGVHAHRGGA